MFLGNNDATISKGRKNIFGWSKIGKSGKIKIPPESYEEYNLKQDKYAILFFGSRTSGGFGLSSMRLLRATGIGKRLQKHPELTNFQIPEGDPIYINERKFTWVKLYNCRNIKPSENALNTFDIETGKRLLVARRSDL